MIELSEIGPGTFTQGFDGDTLNTAIYLARLGMQTDYEDVVTLTSIGRIEAHSAAWQLQAATFAVAFHSAMALRQCRWVAGAERWERGGTKRLRTAENTLTNRCRYLGD